ncbi:MAG: hypothetical protein SH820_07740 [Xanthomonadales bacterium]|nr:hypothetical protein [Xanthomonadales bacterium]
MTNHKPGCSLLWLCSILLTLALGLSHESAFAATFVVTNINSPGQGFNDTTVVAPVTGNPATTLGAQRMAVFQAAADTWGALLVSPVSIVVSAQMTSLNCNASSAVLGSAGAASIFRDFSGAPLSNTWYPAALASSLSGSDLDPGGPDINANFNQDIGQPNCLNNRPWSYVIGAAAPANTISFFDTVVHEIGHGVGVFSLVNLTTGALGSGNRNDSYTQHLLDETPSPTLWTALTNPERVASTIDTGNLTWNGSSVNAVSGLLTAGRHGTSNRVLMNAPNPLQPGSSVSHFDSALTPNEIMEPSLTSVNRRRLSNHLMLDLGWRAHVNLAISKTDSVSSISADSATSYTITIQNNSLADLTAVNLGVTDTMAAALQGVIWTCAGLAGATCAVANGAGNINTTVTIPQGASVSFSVSAIISAAFTGTLTNTANLVLPANLQNSANNSASDNTTVTPAPPPPDLTVSTISDNTTEAAGTATFSVVLNTQPSADVNIGLSSNDITEGTVTQLNLVFTNANWATPQVVTVTGVNDDIDDGDVIYSIITAAATSADSNYQGINPADVSVTNLDDDTAGIEVSLASGDTGEIGTTATFTIELDSEPTHDVTIELSSSDPSEGLAAPASVSFTAAAWFEAKLLTITGQDDGVKDGAIGYTIITAAAISQDLKYSGIDPDDVNVINQDDDNELIFADGFESP